MIENGHHHRQGTQTRPVSTVEEPCEALAVTIRTL